MPSLMEITTVKRALTAALATFLLSQSQNAASAAVDTRSGFENGLRRAIVTAGRPIARFPIEGRMAHYRVPGVSVAIIHKCRVVETRGFGITRAGGSPVSPDTLFQAASISKPVTAFAALRLVGQRQLALDEDIRIRLKTWVLPDSPLLADEDVTLRRLLSHSAGFNVGGFDGYRVGSPLPSAVQILNGEAPANYMEIGRASCRERV